MSIPNHMMIAMQEIESKIDKEAPVKERLKKAMNLAQNHWLVRDEEEQFRCALGAVAVTASQEERQKIAAELAFLKGIDAQRDGVPVDFMELFGRVPKTPYGLNALWMEAKMGEG